ncbi:hypothetical protein [Oceanobacillus rekensis]|uniref:hypothetical protein n=1 Tax=Oceanobacillus rekensis TaxID=937927 RepID=UPI000B42D763|nr:hypothetical protein [Oceanobacillus rekensis]
MSNQQADRNASSNQLYESIEQQVRLLNDILLEKRRRKMSNQQTDGDKSPEQLYDKIEQQEQLLNEILLEIRKDQPSSRPPSKSPFSFLENIDLDVEKLSKIAIFISSLYMDSNEEEDEVQSSRDGD